MKLPSLKDVDYKKVLAVALLVAVVTASALVLASRFSKIEVLGVKLESKTETEETPPRGPPAPRERPQRTKRPAY